MKRLAAALLVILILTVSVAAETLYDGTEIPAEAQPLRTSGLGWSYYMGESDWYSITSHTLQVNGIFIDDTTKNYIYKNFYWNDERLKEYNTYYISFSIQTNLGGSYTKNPFQLLTYSQPGNQMIRTLPIAFYNSSSVKKLLKNAANGLNPGTAGANGLAVSPTYSQYYTFSKKYYSLVTYWQAPTLKVSLVFRFPVALNESYQDIQGLGIGFNFLESSVSMNLISYSMQMWKDIDGSIYDEIVLDQISGIKSSVDSGFQQAHEDVEMLNGTLNQIDDNLDAMHNTLIGDPSYAVDTSSLGSDLDEYADVEAEINNAIMQPITLPDGSQIQTDPSTLLELKSWILSEYDVQNYDPGVGSLINRVFDAFLPAMGSVIFLSLSLGIIVAFLASRRFS